MIVIIGAGIAGLSLAWALAKRGQPVRVLEAGNVAHQASGVATSYLEPRLGFTPMRQIERLGASSWSNYAFQLETASGLQIDYRREGQLRLALDDQAEKFEADLQQREEQGWNLERLTPTQIHELEPALATPAMVGAFLPDICWVDGKKVCQALAKAVQNLGVEIFTNMPVSHIERDDGIVAVTADGSHHPADILVVATGMGGNNLDGLPDGFPKARPVRGVNLVLSMEGLKHPLTRMIKHHRGNMVPRGEDLLLVGTSYDEGNTELDVQQSAIERLYANAETVFPNLRDLPLLGVTAGIRSKVGDGTVALGRCADDPRIGYSLGHAGSGFLRAPVLGEALADYLLEDKRHPLLETVLA